MTFERLRPEQRAANGRSRILPIRTILRSGTPGLVAAAVAAAFCLGLGLPAGTLHDAFGRGHTGFVRLNYYPVRDPLDGSDIAHLPTADMGVHHHSDAGALTILLQDEIGGLQVHRDAAWHDVAPLAGALVVNTGDMLQVWSNDRYEAAIHRVRAMQHRDRYSVPFFFNPAAGTRVSPLPSVVSDTRPARYRTQAGPGYRRWP